jgi:hypothetical protein
MHVHSLKQNNNSKRHKGSSLKFKSMLESFEHSKQAQRTHTIHTFHKQQFPSMMARRSFSFDDLWLNIDPFPIGGLKKYMPMLACYTIGWDLEQDRLNCYSNIKVTFNIHKLVVLGKPTLSEHLFPLVTPPKYGLYDKDFPNINQFHYRPL